MVIELQIMKRWVHGWLIYMRDLVNLPVMVDKEKIAIMQIVDSIISASQISAPALLPLNIALQVKLSIQYGNTPNSAFSYSHFGAIACEYWKDVDTGVQFGQLAFQVVSKLDAKIQKPQVFCIMGFSVLHRKFHLKETLPLQQEGYTSGIEVGNLEFVGYAAHNFCLNAFWCGQPLKTVEREARNYSQALMQLNQLITYNYCRIHWQSILNLQGAAENPSIFL